MRETPPKLPQQLSALSPYPPTAARVGPTRLSPAMLRFVACVASVAAAMILAQPTRYRGSAHTDAECVSRQLDRFEEVLRVVRSIPQAAGAEVIAQHAARSLRHPLPAAARAVHPLPTTLISRAGTREKQSALPSRRFPSASVIRGSYL